jgi:hypothetical protein
MAIREACESLELLFFVVEDDVGSGGLEVLDEGDVVDDETVEQVAEDEADEAGEVCEDDPDGDEERNDGALMRLRDGEAVDAARTGPDGGRPVAGPRGMAGPRGKAAPLGGKDFAEDGAVVGGSGGIDNDDDMVVVADAAEYDDDDNGDENDDSLMAAVVVGCVSFSLLLILLFDKTAEAPGINDVAAVMGDEFAIRSTADDAKDLPTAIAPETPSRTVEVSDGLGEMMGGLLVLDVVLVVVVDDVVGSDDGGAFADDRLSVDDCDDSELFPLSVDTDADESVPTVVLAVEEGDKIADDDV